MSDEKFGSAEQGQNSFGFTEELFASVPINFMSDGSR